MKRVLLKISYDGSNYHGWQSQPNSLTVQDVLQDTLFNVLGEKTTVVGCSRTDAGVHANEFCCHLDCRDNIPASAFLRGLNSCLPSDISVIDFEEKDSAFHARYDTKSKNYIYNFYFGITNPFYERYALRLEKKPDLGLMNDFCKTLIGKHDFFAFSSSGRSVNDTVRTIFDCKAYFDGDFLRFDITGDGFLYNMVRIAAGTALSVGYGKIDKSIALKMFETKDRTLGGDTLSPKGLFLNKVFY